MKLEEVHPDIRHQPRYCPSIRNMGSLYVIMLMVTFQLHTKNLQTPSRSKSRHSESHFSTMTGDDYRRQSIKLERNIIIDQV